MSIVEPAGGSPSSWATKVRPVSCHVNRIGSPKERGALALRSGLFSQVVPAGDEQSFQVTFAMAAEKPPNKREVPPFGMLLMEPSTLWLWLTASLVQLLPTEGSPTLSPTPCADMQLKNRAD